VPPVAVRHVLPPPPGGRAACSSTAPRRPARAARAPPEAVRCELLLSARPNHPPTPPKPARDGAACVLQSRRLPGPCAVCGGAPKTRGMCTPGSVRRRGSRGAAVTHPRSRAPRAHLGPLVRRWVRRGVRHTVRGHARPRRLRCVRSRVMCGPRERDGDGRRAARGPGGPAAARSRRRREPPGDAASYVMGW